MKDKLKQLLQEVEINFTQAMYKKNEAKVKGFVGDQHYHMGREDTFELIIDKLSKILKEEGE